MENTEDIIDFGDMMSLEDEELLEMLDDDDIETLIQMEEENLTKGSFTCVRCSNSVSSKGGRCGSCLNKLRSKRKTPGTKERAWQHADQALRRQRAGKGTTSHKKSSGLGSRKEIVNKMKNAEKRTGEKLSLDRKNNNKGYAGHNTRAVPQKLNRGRHKVDPKKLAAWKKKLKKCDLTEEELKTLATAKAYDDGYEELGKALEDMTQDEFMDVFINTTEEETEE